MEWIFSGIGTAVFSGIAGLIIGGFSGYQIGVNNMIKQKQKAKENAKQQQIGQINNGTH